MSHDFGFALQQLLNIVRLAAFYAPLALAFSLVQSITNRIFLAFGDCAMFASFAAVYACFGLLLHGSDDWQAAVLSLVVAMACAAALGVGSAQLVFLPMMRASAQSYMIAALGFAIALREVMRISSNSGDIWVPPLFSELGLSLYNGDFPVYLPLNSVAGVTAGFGALLAAASVIKFSTFGAQWRACSQNMKLAELCGINGARVIGASFALAGALAATSGWASSIIYGGANFSVGTMLGLKAMFAAVLGGFGNPKAAVMGAFALAAMEVLWSVFFGLTYRDVGVFGIVIASLLIWPNGLGGGRYGGEAEVL